MEAGVLPRPGSAVSLRSEVEALASTARVQMNARLVDGPVLVVTFAPRAIARDVAWGLAPIARLGASLVGFVDFADGWYARLDMEELGERLAPILRRYDRVVTYGHSMGAYGAVKHAARCGASRTVALAPSWSIAPQDVGHFDARRPRAYYRPELHDGMAVRPRDVAPDAVIALDPCHREDRVQYEALVAAGCAVTFAPAHFLRHDILHGVIDSKLTSEFVAEVVNGHGPVGVRSILRRSRAESPRYLAAALRRLRAIRPDGLAFRAVMEVAAPFAGHALIRAAIADAAAADQRPIDLRDPDWEERFLTAEPALAASAVKGRPFRMFFAFRRALRFVEIHARTGDLDTAAAFAEAYAELPICRREPVRLVRLARVIVRVGKSERHFEIAHRLNLKAQAIDPSAVKLFGLTTRLAAEGAVRLEAQYFSSGFGALGHGRWRLAPPRGRFEAIRSIAFELPPGRYRVRLDVSGDRAVARSLALDVRDRGGNSYARQPGAVGRLKARLSRFDSPSAIVEVPDLTRKTEPRLYILAQGDGRDGRRTIEFAGVEIDALPAKESGLRIFGQPQETFRRLLRTRIWGSSNDR